jgi:hypothetical protein
MTLQTERILTIMSEYHNIHDTATNIMKKYVTDRGVPLNERIDTFCDSGIGFEIATYLHLQSLQVFDYRSTATSLASTRNAVTNQVYADMRAGGRVPGYYISVRRALEYYEALIGRNFTVQVRGAFDDRSIPTPILFTLDHYNGIRAELIHRLIKSILVIPAELST